MAKKKQEKKIDMLDQTAPRGETAMVAGTPPTHVADAVTHEQDMENALGMVQQLMKDPKASSPIIMGVDAEGKMRIVKLNRDKEGNLVLPDAEKWKGQTFWSLLKKKRRVKKIMKHLNPILKRDIGEVTSVALMRKSDEQLEKLLKKLEDKAGRKHVGIANRIGCMYIETGEDNIQI